jgi:hypothetical protein
MVTYCVVPEASVTDRVPVIGVAKHQFTVTVRLASEGTVTSLRPRFCQKWLDFEQRLGVAGLKPRAG